jgi:AraC-like DNA-binding protein
MRAPRGVTAEERVALEPSTSFSCRRLDSVSIRYWRHAHPEIELVSVQSGAGIRHIGDSIEPFAEGDVVLVGAGTPHAWHTPRGESRQSRIIYCQFRADPWVEAARLLPELGMLQGLFARAARGLQLTGASGERASTQMRELHAERDPARRLQLLIGVLIAFGDGSGCRQLASEHFSSGTAHPGCERLRRFLHEHLAESIPFEQAAKLAGISAAGFSRFFKKHFNCTYRDYLTNIRIAEACRLLTESDRRVLDIALTCGFANLANFNRRFLARTRLTPSAYRRGAAPD